MKQQNVKQMYFYKNYLMIFLLPLFDLMSKFCCCSLGTGGREKEMINVSQKNPGFVPEFQISFTGLGETTQSICEI